MKLFIVILLILLSVASFCQNNISKGIKSVSVQINKTKVDFLELVYNVDFEVRKGFFIYE